MPVDGQIDRPVSLRFVGDWGGAHLTRVCGWLARELHDRAAGNSPSWIRTGDAGVGNLHALGRGEVDVAVITPSAVATLARRGAGPFVGTPYPFLRALGELPHPDRLLLAVRKDLGVSSVADIRARRMPLRLSTSLDRPGGSFIGYAAEKVLTAAGISPDVVRGWGGDVIAHASPFACIAALEEGRADAVLHEAVMTSQWQVAAESQPLSFLSLEPEVLATAERELACAPDRIPSGFMAGMEAPVDTVGFRGYLVVVRDDMADDVAALLTWILAETAGRFVAMNYSHLPAERSPVHYPVTRDALAQAPIPLHRGAIEYYQGADTRSLSLTEQERAR